MLRPQAAGSTPKMMGTQTSASITAPYDRPPDRPSWSKPLVVISSNRRPHYSVEVMQEMMAELAKPRKAIEASGAWWCWPVPVVPPSFHHGTRSSRRHEP